MEFARVANTGLRLLPDAIGLAFIFAFAQIILLFAMQMFVSDTVAMWILTALAAISHGLFIVIITVRTADDERLRGGPHNLTAGFLFALPLFALAWADIDGAHHVCADGAIVERGIAPMWPWFWIGWAALTLSAAPMHLLGWLNGARIALKPFWIRAAYMAPSALVIGVLGWTFQVRAMDCAAPRLSFGVMDGGLVAIPLYMLFFFAMSFSMAVLSAAFARQAPAD